MPIGVDVVPKANWNAPGNEAPTVLYSIVGPACLTEHKLVCAALGSRVLVNDGEASLALNMRMGGRLPFGPYLSTMFDVPVTDGDWFTWVQVGWAALEGQFTVFIDHESSQNTDGRMYGTQAMDLARSWGGGVGIGISEQFTLELILWKTQILYRPEKDAPLEDVREPFWQPAVRLHVVLP